MDTAILVNDLDENAVKLVKALTDSHFTFTVAALMKDEDSEAWQLVLGIPDLRSQSGRPFYGEVFNAIKANELNLTLNDVKLLDDRNVTFILLKRRFKPTPELSHIIFTGGYIEGVRIPDSIIYRIGD